MNNLNKADEPTRRAFMEHSAKSLLGVSFSSLAFPRLSLAAPSPSALSVIYLYMRGGMTHIDSFDPKPDSEIQGPIEVIKSNVDGIRVGQHLPNIAKHMDKFAVINSMNSNQGAHEQGMYFTHTSYRMRGTIRHPSLSSWVLRLGGRLNLTLPGSYVIGGMSKHPSSGFMGAEFAPVPIGDPEAGLQNSKMQKGVTEAKFNERFKLSQALDKKFKYRYFIKEIRDYNALYEDAVKLMKSEDLEAFDISKETEATRESYGDSAFGQGCLLARRLVERKARFVEVTLNGWDTHADNFERIPDLMGPLDTALSALMSDLAGKGLLKRTLVVLATEFGRTPKINDREGRDHYPKAYSQLIAGGGIKGGQIYGKTDPRGGEVVDNKVGVTDFNATIAYALGMDREKEIFSDTGRPFKIAARGKPIIELF
jgi:hypothetical protein